MDNKKILDIVAMVLVIIGGLNWLLVGALNMDLVEILFSSIPILQQIVYILIGLAALYSITILMAMTKK